MREYDAVLKRVLTRFSPAASALLTGFEVTRWISAELPQVRSLRPDLLGETPAGDLVHIELQSTNDPRMAYRMLEYALAIYDARGKRPGQIVLYAGEAPLRMSGRLDAFGFECRIADLRDMDPEPLLASPSLAENMITILMQRRNQRAAVMELIEKIVAAGPGERAGALVELMILAGLRRIAPLVEKEIENVPILDDIMDHEVLGPKLRRAMAEGQRQGELKGAQAGEQKLLRRQIEKRFGPIPAWALARLDAMSVEQIETTGLRILDAASLTDLLPPTD